MKKVCFRLVCIILLLAGAGLILYPNLQEMIAGIKDAEIINEVQEKKIEAQKETKTEIDTKETPYALLLRDMEAYNKAIFQNHQSGIVDAWSFRQSEFTLSDYGSIEDAVGYLTIDAMDIQLPLYLGATEENLSRGAAVLGQTSMPVGGENTNCVIAAHRGWKGIPMFVDIEKLQVGDSVVLDNLWGTLYYQVSDIRIISPTDTDAIKIQQGQDLLTLITCHPYRYNYQRYVVYCRRTESKAAADNSSETNISAEKNEQVFSQKEINQERILNRIGLLCILAVIVGWGIIWIKKRVKARRKSSRRLKK